MTEAEIGALRARVTLKGFATYAERLPLFVWVQELEGQVKSLFERVQALQKELEREP